MHNCGLFLGVFFRLIVSFVENHESVAVVMMEPQYRKMLPSVQKKYVHIVCQRPKSLGTELASDRSRS